ncbi:metabolite-proton symporter [Fluviicoccus keumensis]|uniref:Metabolite-proton symporter n=1 Tax=Fluviicoccus keumensis TaxID=1435465 RepID=A0A4Q7ZAA2_9GAMM|nr:MFS transporter [Fluviicoccus keumensis]RZU47512.1 metabolite-proton symporter [Fluviicoccus keumensis]
MSQSAPPGNSARRVLFASLIGTTIEFFDFYIYATAAVLVFPHLFFPASDPASATLQSLATFAIAFFARPVGSAFFGHMGDRIGRKATLIASLLTMGVSTVMIGLLPGYDSIGVLAPALLALFRFGQGFGLGGEWGGAVLLATENAPPGRRAWYGMFPQLGAPLGFVCSTGIFLILTEVLSNEQFLEFGWRIPFIASSVLVLMGLYVRLKLTETPVFRKALEAEERVRLPIADVFRKHGGRLLLGTFIAVPSFAMFYLMTVFTLSWGTTHLGYTRAEFLQFQLIGVVFFALTIPLSAVLADRHGRRLTLALVSVVIMLFGAALGPLLGSGTPLGVIACLSLGLGLMGLTYGPVGTVLSELFPTAVRYTGSSLAFNLAGILGASVAPYLATWLATNYGLASVGGYLAMAALLSLLALSLTAETRERDLNG